ncbi:MAG: pilus assembly protein [Roseibium sp.]|nr:pilus assembly protein [Roseibium sp.]
MDDQPATACAPSRRRGVVRVLTRLLNRYTKDREGATAVEFAIIGLPFLTIMLGIFEFGLAFFVNRIVDNAVLETSRLIRTGQATTFDATDFEDALCDNLSTLFCHRSRISFDIDTITTFAGSSALESMLDVDGQPKDSSFTVTGPTEIVVVRVIYRWPMFSALFRFDEGDTGSNERFLYSTFVFRNEPWL